MAFTVSVEPNRVVRQAIRLLTGESFLPVGPPWQNTAVQSGAQVTVNTTSTSILAADADRIWALIKNMTSEVVYLDLSGTAATTDFELNEDEWIRIVGYTGQISGITASVAGTVSVMAF